MTDNGSKNKPISNPFDKDDRWKNAPITVKPARSVDRAYPEMSPAQKESSGKEETAALFQVEYLALEGGGG